ncbi:MAG: hypothetical protein ACYTDU_09260 [Planctomycetota bacterium]
MRALMLLCLTGGLVAAEGDTASDPAARCDALTSARKEIRVARSEFKRLARVEQSALKQARQVVFRETAQGRTMAPGFGAAADLLGAAAAEDKKLAKLCTEMAASYRAMAAALDRKASYLSADQRAKPPAKRADATFKQAHGMLTAAKRSGTGKDNAAAAWSIVRKGDPRYRALAKNMQTLGAALATAEGSQPTGSTKATLARVRQLTDLLQARFEGVATERPQPPPAPPPT